MNKSQLALLELICNSDNGYTPTDGQEYDVRVLLTLQYIARAWDNPKSCKVTRAGRLALVEAANAATKESELQAENAKQMRREHHHDWWLMFWTVLLTLSIEHLGDIYGFIKSIFIDK